MKEKALAILLCLGMVFTLMPATTFANSAPPTVAIGGVELPIDSYYVNGANGEPGTAYGTEPAGGSWNAHYYIDTDNNKPTLEINGLVLTDYDGQYGIYINSDYGFVLHLNGINTVSVAGDSAGAGLYADVLYLDVYGSENASLTTTSGTAEDASLASGSGDVESVTGICVSGNLTVNNGNIEGTATGDNCYGIYVSGDLTVNNGKIEGTATGTGSKGIYCSRDFEGNGGEAIGSGDSYGVYVEEDIDLYKDTSLTGKGSETDGTGIYAGGEDGIYIWDEASLHANGHLVANVTPYISGVRLYEIRGEIYDEDEEEIIERRFSYDILDYLLSGLHSLDITPMSGIFIDTDDLNEGNYTGDTVVITASPYRLTGETTYQWYKVENGDPVVIEGETTATLYFTAEEGRNLYRCIAMNQGKQYIAEWSWTYSLPIKVEKEAYVTEAGTPVTFKVIKNDNTIKIDKCVWYSNATPAKEGGTEVATATSTNIFDADMTYTFTPADADVGKDNYFYACINDKYYSDFIKVDVYPGGEQLVLKNTDTGVSAIKGEDYTYENSVMTLLKAGNYTLSLNDGVTASTHIFKVDSGVSGRVTLTLDDVSMTTIENSVKDSYRIACANTNVDFEMKLTGTNTIVAQSGIRATGNMTITGGGSLIFDGSSTRQAYGIACNKKLTIALDNTGRIKLTGTVANFSCGIQASSESYLDTEGIVDISNFNVGVNTKNFTMENGRLFISGVNTGMQIVSDGKAEFNGGVTDIIATDRALYGNQWDKATPETVTPADPAAKIIIGEGMKIAKGGTIKNTEWKYARNTSTPQWIWYQTISDGEVSTSTSNSLIGAAPCVRILPEDMPALNGTVSITGDAKFGSELTADVTDTNNTGIFSYQWKRGETEIKGANSKTYTPVAADVDNILTCVVTSNAEVGEISKDTSTTVGKANGLAAPAGLLPVSPTTVGGSDGKIKNTTADMEYSTTDNFAVKNNCTATETTGLSADTYYVRYKETGTHNVGVSSVSIEILPHSHSYNTEWSRDETGHWYACSCGDKKDFAAHSPGTAATELAPQVCTVCGYVLHAALLKLDAPEDLSWGSDVKGKAIWTAVANASSYSVQLYKDGTEDENKVGSAASVTGGTTHDFSEAIKAAGTGSYTFKVTAIGNGTVYCNSSQSQASTEYDYVAFGLALSPDGISGKLILTVTNADKLSVEPILIADYDAKGKLLRARLCSRSDLTINGSNGTLSIDTEDATRVNAFLLSTGSYIPLCAAAGWTKN